MQAVEVVAVLVLPLVVAALEEPLPAPKEAILMRLQEAAVQPLLVVLVAIRVVY